ncbi:MAG TPA: EpsI family protein [Planctomycetota bacterium]|nr:EpsI family protein [Planctomycetota bacterium]
MRAFVAVFLPLFVAYAVTLQWCMDRWNAPTQYFEHCWLVPLVAAVVIWYRREQWRLQPAAPDLRGLWLLGPGLLMHLAGAQLMIDSWSAGSLCLTVPGAAWLALGRARLRGLWPVLWLVLFVVPAPIYVEGRVAFTLKEVAVQGGSWLANLLGADIVRAGDLLRPQGSPKALFVADACGGLRSLLAMLTLGYCLAFFTGEPSWRRRTVLLLAAAPLAIAANVARIAVLCLFSAWFGVAFAEGTGHTLANVAEWVSLVTALLLLDVALGRVFAPSAAPGPPGAAAVVERAQGAAPQSRRTLLRVGVALWAAALPLAWLCLHRPYTAGGARAERLPDQIAGYTLVPRTADEEARFLAKLPNWRETLGTADFVYRRYRDERGARINLVALFHDSNWKSVHPPRICIEGSNMSIEADEVVPAAGLGDGVTASRILARSRTDGWRYLTLSLFGTRDWATGDYSAFTWHHLPRALLRRNESGFLLRVETPVQDGEPLAAAEARCAAFLRDIVPAARELLR